MAELDGIDYSQPSAGSHPPKTVQPSIRFYRKVTNNSLASASVSDQQLVEYVSAPVTNPVQKPELNPINSCIDYLQPSVAVNFMHWPVPNRHRQHYAGITGIDSHF